MNRHETLLEMGALLREEAEAYEQLLDACQAHRRQLVSGPGKAFDASLRRQLEAMERCNRLSATRSLVNHRLAADMQLGEPCSTGRLLAALPPEEAEGLAAPYAALKSLCAKTAVESCQNRSLAEHRLDLLQGDFVSLQNLAQRAAGRNPEAGDAAEGSILSFRA